jgi:putative flippase GtrA
LPLVRLGGRFLTHGQDAIVGRDDLTRQIPAFIVVGSIGFCIDAGLTVLIVKGLGLSPLLARPPAVVAATITNFMLNRAFTFGDNRGDWLAAFLRYCLVAASGQALNYAVYAVVLTVIGALGFAESSLVIAFSIACGVGAAMFLTFAGFRFFAFKR